MKAYRLPHLREEDPRAFGQPATSCYEAPAYDSITELLTNVPLEQFEADVKERQRSRAAERAG